MTKGLIRTFGMSCVVVVGVHMAAAQFDRGDWSLTGGDAGQSGWQKSETKLSPDSVPSNVKFLWKIQLGKPQKGAESFSEPLLASRLINAQGFKDMVYWASGDTIYAVDSELGVLLWKKEFKPDSSAPTEGCATTRLGILMEPPPVINFSARRRPPGSPPPPPPPPPLKPSERHLGVAPGGGFFGLKGIYILAADGMLHEQVITTGADFAPPVKFLSAANADAFGLNYSNHVIYSSTGHGCAGVPNGIWSIGLASPDDSVTNLETAAPLALTGPAITSGDDALFVTGSGPGEHSGSVISLAKDMKTENWYTPSGGMGSYLGVSPIAFTYKGKELAVAPGKDGSIALLDAEAPGGADHQTPLFETPALAKPGEKHGWDGFAEYQDKEGSTWVFASISSAITLSEGDVQHSGSTPHGGIVAFKLEDDGSQSALKPVWVSPDMVNPAPPRIANGVVIALAGGDASTHATLWMLNAATGAVLYSSKSEIPTYTGLSGVAVGDGHAFFTDHDNVLYSFGIAMEH
jgi:hypothetical protein